MELIYAYITTNLINGKQYVGEHLWKDYSNDHYFGSGGILTLAIKKHGKHNFEHRILEFFDTKEEAFNAQEKYINEYNTLHPNGYNLSPKGGYGVENSYMSDYTKKKISENNANHRPEVKEKLRIIHTGKHHSKDTISKIRNSITGMKYKKRGN